ncbi:MAG: hypothetical protein ACI39R_00520 [Lachnospiraceae bacterium]
MNDKRIPAIAEALANDYAELALMNFSMEFYNVYEQFYDCELGYIENGRNIMEAVVEAAADIYSGEKENAEVAAGLDKTRKELMDRMEVLTAYTDWFQIREYLLNRVELKFEAELPEVDNDEEARKLLQFVFEPEDNTEVNLRIKEMISQLPVRMTSSRFFDLLKDSISVYKGAEKESLNGFIYMVLSAAGLFKPESDCYFNDLELFKEPFKNADYKNMDKDTYEALSERMEEIGIILSQRSEFCIMCQKLVNNLYTYYTVSKYSDSESCVKEQVRELIEIICHNFSHEFSHHDDFCAFDVDKANGTFSALEGRPEKLINKISAAEGRLESAREELDAVDPEIYEDFDKASKLMSSSDFALINEGIDTTECSQEIIETACAKLIDDLQTEFENMDRPVRRAVMASVLKELPVFFVSHTEVMNYVRFTLEHCRDKAEKTASLRMFWKVYE